MNTQKFLFLPLAFSFAIPVYANDFSTQSFQQIYNEMHNICEEFKGFNYVSDCNDLNVCKTVLQTKKDALPKSKYPMYVEKWNTTLATFDIYSVCKVLKEKTSCMNVDCLNSPIKEVQANINKCSGISKKCADWFSNQNQSEMGVKVMYGNVKVSSPYNTVIDIDDRNIDRFKQLTGANIRKGDSIYSLNLMMNNKYIGDLHKKMGLSFREVEPLMSIYFTAEDVSNLDNKIANEVGKQYSTFLSKAVYPVFPDDKTLTVDWMKSCVYEVLSSDISGVKVWAPGELEKHNQKTSLPAAVITTVKEKTGDVISTVKDKVVDVKKSVAPHIKSAKEKAKSVVSTGRKRIMGR